MKGHTGYRYIVIVFFLHSNRINAEGIPVHNMNKQNHLDTIPFHTLSPDMIKLMSTARRNLRIVEIDYGRGKEHLANLTYASNILEFKFPFCSLAHKPHSFAKPNPCPFSSWGIYFQTQTTTLSFLDFQASTIATLGPVGKTCEWALFLVCF